MRWCPWAGATAASVAPVTMLQHASAPAPLPRLALPSSSGAHFRGTRGRYRCRKPPVAPTQQGWATPLLRSAGNSADHLHSAQLAGGG